MGSRRHREDLRLYRVDCGVGGSWNLLIANPGQVGLSGFLLDQNSRPQRLVGVTEVDPSTLLKAEDDCLLVSASIPKRV